MQREAHCLTLIASVLLASPSAADVLVVPDEYATIAAAIAAAAPGDVVLVHDSAGVPNGEPVIIDKPLTLVGEPWLELESYECADHPIPNGAVWLDGPGAGTVTLIGLRRKGPGLDCLWPAPFIGGGGFEALHIYDSEIQASNGGQTGAGQAGVTVDADVARVVVVNSVVRGGSVGDADCAGMPSDAGTAIRLPGGTVVAIDSTIVGGQAVFTCCTFCDCPDDPASLKGHGGLGVEAGLLYTARSTVRGGPGAQYGAYASASGQPVSCAPLPGGQAMLVGSHVVFTGDLLQGSGPMHQGEGWLLSSDLSSPSNRLFWSSGVSAPLSTGYGLTLLDLAFLVDLGHLPAGPQQLVIQVPTDTYLVGLQVVLQALGSQTGLSLPVLTAVVP